MSKNQKQPVTRTPATNTTPSKTEETDGRKREVSQEKLDAMRIGRMNAALKSAVYKLIEEHVDRRDKSVEDAQAVIAEQVKRYFDLYDNEKEDQELLARLQEEFGDRFIVKRKTI